jgi:class 3 adenylate cyclase
MRQQNCINNKINLFNGMSKSDFESTGVMLDGSTLEIEPTNSALYAETVPTVCIIFVDVVNFCEISYETKPIIKVMDMLQTLFTKFDDLCDKYGIQRLETIGDVYICTTAMFGKDTAKSTVNEAADALSLAKDMIKAARTVSIPNKAKQTVEIRVGIHRGDLTCGVLGERLPKFTVFGSSVNLAARMLQTCHPSMIHVTKAFHDALPQLEDWQKKEFLTVKNMGQVETYLSNP